MAESSKIDRKKKHARTSTQPFSAGDHPTRPARHSVPARGYQKCLWRQVVSQAVPSGQRTLARPAEAAPPPSRPPAPRGGRVIIRLSLALQECCADGVVYTLRIT